VSVVGKASVEDTNAHASANADQNKDANSAAPAKADDSVKPGQTPAEREKATSAWKAKFADQKDKIKLLSRELDVLQREYKLKAADFYNNTALRAQNASYFAADDAKYKQQIADKQKDLDAATAKLASMQEEARKTGVPNSATE
jgi:hypothetical protein